MSLGSIPLKSLSVTLSLLAALATPTFAQDMWLPTVLQGVNNGIVWDALRSSVYSSGGSSSFQVDMLALGAIPSDMSAADFEVPVDSAIRQAALSDFFELVEEVDPALALQLDQLDIFALMAESLSAYGLSTANFADAMTSYILELYGVANGLSNDAQPSSDQVTAVRQQVINMVAQSVTPQEMGDRAAIQSASDELLLKGLFINLMQTRVSLIGDIDQMQALKNEVAALTRDSFGVDFSQTTLTPQGLALR